MKTFVFIVAVVIGVAGFVGRYVSIPYVTAYADYLIMSVFALLMLGYMAKSE